MEKPESQAPQGSRRRKGAPDVCLKSQGASPDLSLTSLQKDWLGVGRDRKPRAPSGRAGRGSGERSRGQVVCGADLGRQGKRR